ncbi:MAG: hypothetical protein Q7K34_03290, partial [archaeon]|nr:hypothetical protein [archaeon]
MQPDILSAQNLINIAFVFLLAIVLSTTIIGSLIGIALAFGFWKKHKELHEKSLGNVLLEVTVPRENEIKVDAAEQLFSSLSGIKGTKGVLGFLKVPDS